MTIKLLGNRRRDLRMYSVTGTKGVENYVLRYEFDQSEGSPLTSKRKVSPQATSIEERVYVYDKRRQASGDHLVLAKMDDRDPSTRHTQSGFAPGTNLTKEEYLDLIKSDLEELPNHILRVLGIK